MMMWYRCEDAVITLFVTIQPGAKKTEIVGLHGDVLKIRLQALPIEGRANKALLKFFAEYFKVPVRQVVLLRGELSRIKTLQIQGSSVDPETLLAV